MEKAKAAVSDFISKSGHHDTTVHESVDPSVEKKTINPHQREERTIATDREVHQDHYHTTVQPVHDREVLPEQHHHNLVPVEHRTHDNRDHEDTKTKLSTAKAQFKDEQVRSSTQHTSQTMPTVGGEHVHHHIHETIQPVVHKETIEPHVMHTTVPVHEVHHNKAQHHAASALPAMSIDEFKKGGGVLTGREERVDHFKGEPKNIERSLAGGSSGLRDSGFSSGSAGGMAGSGIGGTQGTTGSGLTGSHGTGSSHHGAGTAAGTAAGVGAGALAGEKMHDRSTHGTTGSNLTGNQGLGSTSSSGVTPGGLASSRNETNTATGNRGAVGAVSGMTGSPHDHHGGESGMTGSRGAGAAAAGAAATTVGRDHDKSGTSGLTGSHGTSGNPTMRDTTSGTHGTSSSTTTGGGLGEFSHRHDGQHPTSVTQGGATTGVGSSAAGMGTTKSGSSGSSGSPTTKKPSLMDRLNPKKDADGDGKAGFMS